MNAIPRTIASQNWLTLIFLGILLILVFVKIRYPVEFFNFRRILGSNKYFTENRKSPKVLGFFGFSLFFAQAVIFSLGFYFLLVKMGTTKGENFFLFTKVFAVYSVFIGSKYFIEKILGTLFSIDFFLDSYIFYKITFKNFIALCLLPLLILLGYLWQPQVIFLKVAAVVFLGLNGLGLMVFYHKRRRYISSNLLYFILYLCILEIAPYYILYKVMA